MATYHQLQSDPATKSLFGNRITTLEGLQRITEDTTTAFVALDTEHVEVAKPNCHDRILHQVGLAFQKLGPHSGEAALQRLPAFYRAREVQGMTLNIMLSHKHRDSLTKVPTRRSHRFGQERHIKLGDLEAAVIDFIQGCTLHHNHDHNGAKLKLVLVGFELAAEWTYLSQEFPRALPYFSSWLDIRDVASDIAPIGCIPGRVSTLQIVGYRWQDIKPAQRGDSGTADNAGDDALSVLALADALLYPENRQKLIFRQQCGQIAGIFKMKKGAWVPKTIGYPFAATLSPVSRSIDSGMKLAQRFFHLDPIFAGLMSPETAYLAFKNEDKLQEFIQATNGLVLPTGDKLLVTPFTPSHESQLRQKANKRKDPPSVGDELAKVAENIEEIEGLGDLFS